MNWTIDKSKELYQLDNWSDGYFDIGDNGHIICRPVADSEATPQSNNSSIDLCALVKRLTEKGIHPPVLLRFCDILQDRVKRLHQVFAQVIKDEGYGGSYTPVYPIKVNQQSRVVGGLSNQESGRVGLECGSKAELMACMAIQSESELIVCNGYKDLEYIKLALIAIELEHRVFIVIEKLSEIDLIVQQQKAFGIKSALGLRLRLSSIGNGNWQNTGGGKSKFGLSAAQIIELFSKLEQHQLLENLQFLHFHMGSQIADIDHFENGIREAMRFLVDMTKKGANFTVVDVGGGLAVDYEATHCKSFFSMNYSLAEYAQVIVSSINKICKKEHILPPEIITECGRAMTAHHEVLIVEVIDTEKRIEQSRVEEESQVSTLHKILTRLNNDISTDNCEAILAEAEETMKQVLDKFISGHFDLQQRSLAECLYAKLCEKAHSILRQMPECKKSLFDHVSELVADKIFCNFSIFQSIPDVWAIDQVFPILPLQRLDEYPQRTVLIKDLTCDSDGRIDFYAGQDGQNVTLKLHNCDAGSGYFLGIFLVGAYQEILGDMHNLFGDTHSVDVKMRSDGEYDIVNVEKGDTVTDVLNIIHYDSYHLKRAYQKKIDKAHLSGDRKKFIFSQLSNSLESYTYLFNQSKVEVCLREQAEKRVFKRVLK